jgi:hypothetical protein
MFLRTREREIEREIERERERDVVVVSRQQKDSFLVKRTRDDSVHCRVERGEKRGERREK